MQSLDGGEKETDVGWIPLAQVERMNVSRGPSRFVNYRRYTQGGKRQYGLVLFALRDEKSSKTPLRERFVV